MQISLFCLGIHIETTPPTLPPGFPGGGSKRERMDHSDLRSIRNHVFALVIADIIVAGLQKALQLLEQSGQSIGVLGLITSTSTWVLLLFVTLVVALSYAIAYWIAPLFSRKPAVYGAGATVQRAQTVNAVGEFRPRRSWLSRLLDSLKALIGQPSLRVRVLKFDRLDAGQATSGAYSREKGDEALADFVRRRGTTCNILFQVVGCGEPTMINHVLFLAKYATGKSVVCEPSREMTDVWVAPQSWSIGKTPLITLSELRMRSIKKGDCENVYTHIVVPHGADDIAPVEMEVRLR